MVNRRIGFLALVMACGLASNLLAESHPFSVQDLVTLERLSDPQPSPDGRWAAVTVRSTDLEADKGRTDLWRISLNGEMAPQRLTSHPDSDQQPRWSPDGKSLFFLSTRSGSSQVWRLSMSGGEAEQVTDLPLDVANLVVAADGHHLAFTMEVFVDCENLACTVDRLKEKDAVKTSGQVHEQLFFRHWDTWKDGRRSHLFVWPTEGGEPRDVSRGLDADVPPKPFGGPEEIAFTPDGGGIVFTARNAGREESWSTDLNLFLAPLDGSEAPRQLTDNPAVDTQPVFSPDGKTLAYLAMKRPGYEADRLRVVLRDWPGGEERVLTEAWDRSARGLVFSADGQRLFVTATDIGQVPLFAIDTVSGKVEKVIAEGHVRDPRVVGDRLLFGRDDLRSPVDLWTSRLDGSEVEQLTHFNQERLAQMRFGEPEAFSFPGWNKETVHGFVVKPVDFDPSKKYPIAFLIHGGPQGSFGNDFHYRWNPQVYAGAGYAAVMIDFHGSTGYGQAFTDSIGNDWGGKPLIDLKRGLAAVLENHPWLDGDRVCALGASYGGYMINWIAGNWPERFRCLVNHDGVFDTRMMYYTTEELWFTEWEFRGTPWENVAAYDINNPAEFVDKWQTPMLVIHGALDYRVPETQGFAAFTALQRRGISSQLLYFPDENHWVLKPNNSIEWHERVLAWLEKWSG